MDEATFKAKAQNLGNNIHKIKQNVKNIQKMITQISSLNDCKKFQEHLQKIFEETNNLARMSTEQLKELNSFDQSDLEKSRWKTQCDALQEQLKKALLRLTEAQAAAVEKESEVMKKCSVRCNAEGQGGEKSPAQSLAMLEQQQIIKDMEERAEALRKLETDIVEIHELFKEVAILVHDQGQTINEVEINTEDAKNYVEKGLAELKEADKLKRKSRKKQCFIAIVCAVVLLTIIIIVAVVMS